MEISSSLVHRKFHPQKIERTRSITFRLPAKDIDELETEAAEGNVSLNVITKQIIQKHLQWDRYACKIGMRPVPDKILKTVGNCLEADDIHKLVDGMHSIIKDQVMFMKGKYDLKRCIEALDDYMKFSGIKSDHRVEGDLHHFIIQHELGIKWSLFTELLLKQIFHEFFPGKNLKFQTTNSTIIATIALGADFDEHDY